ncbi:MAG TPA: hypothetical protein VF090_00385 [Methyloceanibacter sp.]
MTAANVAAAEMAATHMAAAEVTATAAMADKGEKLAAGRGAGRFKAAINLRLGGLLRDRRDYQATHQGGDRNRHQCIFHDVSLLARAESLANRPGDAQFSRRSIESTLGIGSRALIGIKPGSRLLVK